MSVKLNNKKMKSGNIIYVHNTYKQLEQLNIYNSEIRCSQYSELTIKLLIYLHIQVYICVIICIEFQVASW